MTTDSCSLPGRRGDVAQVVGLRSTSEGAGLEVRLVHAAALERASPCVERSHPTGARHSARGELIKLIVDQPASFVGYSLSLFSFAMLGKVYLWVNRSIAFKRAAYRVKSHYRKNTKAWKERQVEFNVRTIEG